MPYKSQQLKIAHTRDDKRIKLSPGDKDRIKKLHRLGQSIHALARNFGVSRRLIQFIIYPERHARNLRLRADRGGSKTYYDKDRHTKAVRKHRRYKQELYLKNNF